MVMTSCPPILLLLQCWVESQGRGYDELSTNPLVVTVLGGVTGAWLCRVVHQSSCYSAGWSHRGVVMTSCPPILLLLQCWVESQGRGYDELFTNPLVVTVHAKPQELKTFGDEDAINNTDVEGSLQRLKDNDPKLKELVLNNIKVSRQLVTCVTHDNTN